MLDSPRTLLMVNITALVLAFLLALPAISSLVRCLGRLSHAKDQFATNFYTDRDGDAAVDAVQAVTRWRHRVAIAVIHVGTCGVALARAIVTPTQDGWIHFGISTLLVVQSVALLLEPHTVARFSLGLQISANGLIALITVFFQRQTPTSSVPAILMAVECGCLILTSLFGLLLPRRPDVCRNGTVVDRENSTSFLGRITFSWAATVMVLVGRGKDVDVDQLPELDHDSRAENLQRSFSQAKENVQRNAAPTAAIPAPMWKILLRAHRHYLLLEFVLCLVQAVVAFSPNLSLLAILRFLEGRSEHGLQIAEMLVIVVALGASMMLSSFMENWLYWVAWNKISVRVYEQISIIVFNKAMRMTGSSSPKATADGEEKDADTQNAINLVAVDGQRVATFATFCFNLLLAPLKLVVACVLLNNLLGWQSLLTGIANLVILTPLIVLCGREYAAAGGDLMGARDGKMAILSEVLQGIRQVKFAALESKWERKIHELRRDELAAQRRVFVWNATTMSLYLLGPILLAIGSLGIYAIRHNGLTSSVAFTAISVLATIQISLGMIPELLSNMLDALGSMRRLDEFFMAPEKQPNLTPSTDIGFHNATVAWFGTATKDHLPWTLRELNLDFPRGELSIISGRTGSGKSLLLAATLGECDILHGEVKAPVQPHHDDIWSVSTTSEWWIVDSAVAYVAQLPWIEAATVKENILFGLPLHAERYKQVLHACALLADLEIFPDGERTEIGPNGVNLSGGQKARISLARALYSRAGILILDDIFSAVDVHTAQHLYKHALTGPLATGRTRILATHHVGICLPDAGYIVHLQNGMVELAGKPADLQDNAVLEAVLNSQSVDDEEEPSPVTMPHQESDRPRSAESRPESQHEAQAFVRKERGRTSTSVLQLFHQYISASGSWHRWGLLVLGYLSYTSLTLGRNWWLRTWSSKGTGPSEQSTIDPSLKFYLAIYIAIAACEWIMGSLQVCFVFLATLQASESLFQECLQAVLRAPLRWLDTVPLGQILNRFSADFNQVDSRLCADLTLMLNTGMVCVSIVVAGLFANRLLIIFTIPLAFCWVFFARQYLIASREVKRIENISRSPVYEQINTSLTGLWTIRAYGKSPLYIHAMQDRIDRHARAFWTQWLLTRWLGLRVSMIGAIFAACVALLVTTQGKIDAATAGFTISFAVQLTGAMTPCIRSYTNVELGMNAVDRVLEYSDIEPEIYDGIDPPAAWPTNGRVEVTDLTVKYAPSLPPVLRGLNFVVEGSQRIGIVGRTGAGKSSLALALFRFLEASEGQILIDGIDISKVKLAHLRSRLAIIPQNPVLFSGTIRSNLDPFDEVDDSELLAALSQARFTPEQSDSPEPSDDGYTPLPPAVDYLETPVSQGGLNFSQGQRQLLCLARAIVANPKILMLDEATSAVDHTTDSQIQEALRAKFGRKSSTLLVIAHRLSTIADFDRILVLDNGATVEFGHPRDLMEMPNGVFRGMVDEDAEREKLMEVIYS
ncbi:P-loop containing nucleoside triphosphate hydrolase protein [Aspergillus transmontanensis]|uniref:P-loop containing nucleoside triphosphate hydrolase protein n=1 Tax=Aspergillus transmontanensis TaxID=1034304 RepID=A0A5N6W6E4_9EURO|nr:P-loop containing nucleoside triphosphate hydrolase protein [Aspergillus transmontanensis]